METCDISIVKEETFELIKTEPQNEDEFDMCGSSIKTEFLYKQKNFMTWAHTQVSYTARVVTAINDDSAYLCG
uniref:Uncharacterized protein n=1 Tax=Timema cristinae TaxID=61476 RepID=A0A7R9D528_TIMCR|nr:unnamed protein product [Timema cristinae]